VDAVIKQDAAICTLLDYSDCNIGSVSLRSGGLLLSSAYKTG